jgi:chorismate mutase
MSQDRQYEGPSELERLRADIGRLDEALIQLLVERVRMARQAGSIKREEGLPITDRSQEAAVIQRAAALARDHGMSPDEVGRIFQEIIVLTRQAQHAEGGRA